MNEHIQRGNEAMRIGDIEAAKEESYLALDDPDWCFPYGRQNFLDLYIASTDRTNVVSGYCFALSRQQLHEIDGP